MANRTKTFQTLKPTCVDLGQKTLNFSNGKASAQDVVTALDSLVQVLSAVTSPRHGLDSKIAEYVFFPLTQVFRIQQKLPSRAIEIALTCLNHLLQSGWRKDIPADLAAQLVILLTVLAGGDLAGPKSRVVSEELQIAAFVTLASLFVAIENSGASKKALIDTANIPALGHAVTVILDGAVSGKSHPVQLAALNALQSMLQCLPDREVLASFLPGIVSALTKILTPNTAVRRSFKVITQSLEILSSFLAYVLADEFIGPILDSEPSESSTDTAKTPALSSSWVKANAAQVKLALANVVRQRKHDRLEVRQALLNLCMALTERCRKALIEAMKMMLENIIMLAQHEDLDGAEDKVKGLIVMDSDIAELIRESLYDWLVSLPRIMQSNDDDAKRKAIGQVAMSLRLLSDVGVDMKIIENMMTDSLRDSVINAIHIPKRLGEKMNSEDGINRSQKLQLINLANSHTALEFAPVLVGHKSGRDTIKELQSLISQISTSENSMILVRDLLDIARYGQDENRLASFWLSLNILRSNSKVLQLEDIMDISDSNSLRTDMSEEMYAFSLSRLEDLESEMDSDWRIQALALEGLAFRASQLKHEFRHELVEALYPVLHLMGSQFSPVSEHAMICLNVIASECGYKDAKDLVVSNVDYLVNAIGLKLSVFDISPQLPQVLRMMIKLCGPTLLPYLDDLVENIFEALECFHGYPKLVEILFSVLQSMVEEGVKAPQLTIASKEENSESTPHQPMSIEELISTLQEPSNIQTTSSNPPTDLNLPTRTPHQAWKDFNTRPAPPSEDDHDDHNENDEELPEAPAGDPPAPVLPKAYTLLQRIATLTQHHLPSSSTSLRLSLLELLTTALPSLAIHDDAYLPLINTLWPVLLPRLADKEASVVAGVLNVMGLMCASARSFMVGRISSAWSEVQRIWRGIASVLSRGAHAAPGPVSSALPALALQNITASAPSAPQSALISSSSPSLALTPAPGPSLALASTRSQSQTPYIPAPTRVLYAHTMKFLLRVLTFLGTGSEARLPWFIGIEAAEMLVKGLALGREVISGVGGLGEHFEVEVREGLEAWNADALWLLDLRGAVGRGQGMDRDGDVWAAKLKRAENLGSGGNGWVDVF